MPNDIVNEPLWRAHQPPRFTGQPFPNEIDVAIVGGGITGLTAAYLLKQAGKRVAVFEREHIGSGETGNTSAHLTYVTDLGITDLADRFGRDAARRVWEGGAAAIDLIETNATDRNIACGFQRVPGHMCAEFKGTDDETKDMQEEADLAAELGFAARFVANGPITGKPAVAYADQAVFHPLDYVSGLAQAVNGDGSFVFDMAEVSAVLQDPLSVTVNGETIACGDVVIATHVPIVGSTPLVSATLFQTKIYPYSSYVLGAWLANDSVAPGLYSDTASPYYYLRVHQEGDRRYAIFGGEDHKTGAVSDTEERYAKLEASFRELVPDAEIERRWSGQVVETVDGLPYVGKTADHQYEATGYTGNGLTFGTLSGMMLRDAVLGNDNPWRELFDPNRKPTSAGALAEYVSENVDYPYHMVADRLRRDTSPADSVGAGDGKVLVIEGQRVAVHRTEAGELLKVSAVCTHMGCLVRWNGAEKTWDCPCHGSRFTPEGLVLGGPAETALEKVERTG